MKRRHSAKMSSARNSPSALIGTLAPRLALAKRSKCVRAPPSIAAALVQRSLIGELWIAQQDRIRFRR